MDFTIKQYSQLLKSLQNAGFFFQTLEAFIKSDNPGLSLNTQYSKHMILRHDVDNRPANSLHFAKLQANLGVKGTYYFRVVSQSYHEDIIREISALGHEIGYHYETMDTCNGDVDKAYGEFCHNLEKFRKITEIKTISMHGSPMSKHDNRDIWQKYDYKKLGIIAEPYFDINFNELFYLTDTGRRWDGDKFNVRDKPIKSATVRGRSLPLEGKPDGAGRPTKENPVTNPEFLKLRFHHTSDIIKAVNEGKFPKRAMLNFHPQRWNDAFLPWVRELVWQNMKNQVKRFVVKG